MKKFLVVVAALIMVAGTVQAAEWNFYGHARVGTFFTDFEKDPFSAGGAGSVGSFAAAKDTKNYEEGLYGNARIGAKVKVNDSLKGRFEYGTQSGNANVRLLYGEWDFGMGSLLVGKNYTPLIFPYSNQVYGIDALGKGDHNMSTFGMLYGSRKAQIRLKMGGFRIALVDCKSLVYYPNLSPTTTAHPETEINFPAIQAKYKYDFPFGSVGVAGGYFTFEVGDTKEDVDSYVLGVGGKVNMGPAYLKANVWGGQNVGNQADILVNQKLWSTKDNAGSSSFDGDGFGLAKYNGTTKKVTDRDALAYMVVAGMEIRKGLYIEAGYGHVETELDEAGAKEDEADTYYIQSTIFLAEGVFLTPEVGYVDMKEENQSEITYYGIKWQINF